MLVFGLRAGESFYVADQRVELLSVARGEAVIRAAGERVAIPIGDMRRICLPGVVVRVGVRVGSFGVRVGVEAPRDVKVLRASLYAASRRGLRPEPRGPRVFHARAMACARCRGRMLIDEQPCPAAGDPRLPICQPSV